MLFLVGVDRKRYGEVFRPREGIPQIPCPLEGCRSGWLNPHGWHRRYVDGSLTRLRRVRCAPCGVTHVILPEDMCAYRDTDLFALEAVLEAGGGPSQGAGAAQQEGERGVRRVRRWQRAFAQPWIWQLMALLAPAPGPWFRRVQAMVGSARGYLLRLRHWLWRTASCLFSGLTGLWRHGRRCSVPELSSTHIGSCPAER
jgi:hypothetical protein